MNKRDRFYVVTEIWDMNLSSGAQAVYTYLSFCADNKGECYPSIRRIAEECGMCRNTARKMINELVSKGFISCVPRMLKTERGNRLTSNLYRLRSSRIFEDPIETEAPLYAEVKRTGEKPTSKAPEMQSRPITAAAPARTEEEGAAELNALLDRLGIADLYEDKHTARALELAITELWFAERTKICGEQVPRWRMRERLNELDIEAIDDVMFALGQGNVKNKTDFLKSCLYNAPLRANARIACRSAEVQRETWEQAKLDEYKRWRKAGKEAVAELIEQSRAEEEVNIFGL